MVAYCKDCRRYINQYCEICGTNFGVEVCERFGCGGKMLCPNCGGNNLTDKRESVGNPYDFKKEREKLYGTNKRAASDLEAKYFADKKMKEVEATQYRDQKVIQDSTKHCPLCGYSLRNEWKFCPECGVSLIKK